VERARAALETLGWTVVASTRDDEVLATMHDNLAVVRWSGRGWWVRVEQGSDFISHQPVPAWDHPWEALRLLHLIVPDAVAGDGWQPFQAQELRRLFEARLRTALSVAGGSGGSQGGSVAAKASPSASESILGIAVAERRDPFSVLPATTRFARTGDGRRGRFRAINPGDRDPQVIDALVEQHMDQVAGFFLTANGAALLHRLEVPGMPAAGMPSPRDGDVDPRRWWNGHGKAWVASLAEQGAP
jgi:hypothetical protein